jgi:hypothetical protein
MSFKDVLIDSLCAVAFASAWWAFIFAGILWSAA